MSRELRVALWMLMIATNVVWLLMVSTLWADYDVHATLFVYCGGSRALM